MWDLCHGDDSDNQPAPEDSDADAQLFMTLSSAAVSDRDSTSTMQFRGEVQGRQVRILLDSGSSNTFVSASLAAHLQGSSDCDHPTRVMVANGTQLWCDT